MKFRFHRGGLEESLKTTVNVNSIKELKSLIEKQIYNSQDLIEDIVFEYQMFDKRTSWETYYVMYKIKDEKHYYVAGMSDGKLIEKNNNKYLVKNRLK